MRQYIHNRKRWCQNYASNQKKFQIKVVRNWISYKKVNERICLSPPEMELGAQKIDIIIGGYDIVEVLFCTETAKYIQLMAQCH